MRLSAQATNLMALANERSKARRSIFLLSAAAGALVCCIAVAGGCHGGTPLTGEEETGKRLYSQRCAHCHEENDLALKKVPPDLHGVFAHSSLPGGEPATDEQVQRVVLAGRGMMPSFAGRFDDEQMKALLAYLHTGLQ
jgi:mono/diheme cytochrome c family protein